MFAPGESLTAFNEPDLLGQEIHTILAHRDDVLHSFLEPTVLDPNDLQAPYVSHLRSQREALLRTFRVENSTEIMRDPNAFFQTIVAEFQDQHRARLVWGRAHEVVRSSRAADEPRMFAETAHVIDFVRKPGGLQPTLWTRIVHTNSQPSVYCASTRLHHTEDWQYVFSSSSAGLEVYREGYERGGTCMVPIEDPIDHVTLLQALGVEMLAAITQMHKYQEEVQAINHEYARRRTHELVHRPTL